MAGRYIPPKPATLEGDQQRLGVTDEQLDREINPLQFTNIARHIGNTTTFEIAFRLDENERQQINTTKILKSNLDGTIQMFELWKKKVKRHATYRNLLRIVYGTIRNAEMGEKIFKIAAPAETTRPSRSGRVTPEHQTMVKCTGLLVNEFTEHVEDFGDAFYSEYIIGPSTWDKTKSKIREPKDKARDLVGALTSKVQSSAEYFEKIVDIIHDQGDWTENIISGLRKVFKDVNPSGSGIGFPQLRECSPRAEAGGSLSQKGNPSTSLIASNSSETDTSTQDLGMFFCGSRRKTVTEKTSKSVRGRAATIRDCHLWGATQELKVHFMNPKKLKEWNWKHGNEPITTGLILSWAGKWNNKAGQKWPRISDDLGVSEEDADIRVKFVNEEKVRSRSLVGCCSRSDGLSSEDTATMYLNFSYIKNHKLQRSTVIHEFGHALGLDHEHQRSDFWKILGKKEGGKNKFIYSFEELEAGKGKDENGEEISFGQIDKEHLGDPSMDSDIASRSVYDSKSIMHYWFDKLWLRQKYLQGNFEDLSEEEKTVIRGVICRDYRKGQLAENPSNLDYDTLERAYSDQSHGVNKAGNASGSDPPELPQGVVQAQNDPVPTVKDQLAKLWRIIQGKLYEWLVAFMKCKISILGVVLVVIGAILSYFVLKLFL